LRETTKQKNEKLAVENKTLRHFGLKFEIKPTDKNKILFAKSFGVSRFTSNFYLKERQEVYQETGKTLKGNEFKKSFIKLKKHPCFDFLAEVDKFCIETAIESAEDAYARFFTKQNGFPAFKSKHQSKQSYSTKFTENNIRLDVRNNRVKIPIVGWVKANIPSRTKEKYLVTGFNDKILGATISHHSGGKYFVSLRIEQVIPLLKPVENVDEKNIIAIDWGLAHFAIDSNGNKIQNPRHTKKYAKKVARLQKKVAKSKKGSNNNKKIKKKVAKIHVKISNTRKDFLHKYSRQLINDNQVIILEDLTIQNLLKNKKLAKQIQDTGWGMFKTFLSYKALWAGKRVVFIDRFFPSSKLCSSCLEKKNSLSLSEREWICAGCGETHDRDFNAAINIKKEGIRILSC
jgi:putative transposase